MKRKFEILDGLPAHGDMYISIPENGYKQFSEGLAVKFIRKDNSEWVGNFERGNSQLRFASEIKDSTNILIIAFGICYIIDIENVKPIIEFGLDYKEVFEYKNLFVLIGECSISVVEDIDKINHFEHLCFDGITNVELGDGILRGVLNEFCQSTKGLDKSNFTLNLETFDFNETPQIVLNKKWWKIW
ncbi:MULTISPECIES: hypothetical protein [unclassified Flavobacterium]|uniref:hypothetical protein n=1 Tax=unclassified Flavobacterium TaxID=196869 RepID=UPI000F14DE36|nr:MULTISPECIES: hypothetical protein [unclassified Flavobacterium]RKS03231.1 hypothetical protein C8C84_2975 [Flavobacterium sp. 102]